MKLPNWENAYIPTAKLGDYLLSDIHPIGRHKARVLFAAGFDRTDVRFLEQALLAVVYQEEVTDVIPFQYGTKYIVEGDLQSPTGTFYRL